MANPQIAGENISGVLTEILDSLKSLRQENSQLTAAIDKINGRVNVLASVKQVHDASDSCESNAASRAWDKYLSGEQVPENALSNPLPLAQPAIAPSAVRNGRASAPSELKPLAEPPKTPERPRSAADQPVPAIESSPRRITGFTSKIILTSYPGQSGADPVPMNWGDSNPNRRGPVVVSRHKSTIGRRNGEYNITSDALASPVLIKVKLSVLMADRTQFIMPLPLQART
jgi:GTP cyclohydrolase N terminal